MKVAAILAAGALVASPATAQPPCLNDAEAESLVLVALPDILQETGRVCGARLAADSPIRKSDGPLIARYQAEADRAWPAARGAIVKLSDPAVEALLQSDYARPLLSSILVPLVVGRIALDDCPVIDRLVTQLAPLPPRNTASFIVTTIQYLRAEQAKGRSVALPNLPLCKAGK